MWLYISDFLPLQIRKIVLRTNLGYGLLHFAKTVSYLMSLMLCPFSGTFLSLLSASKADLKCGKIFGARWQSSFHKQTECC